MDGQKNRRDNGGLAWMSRVLLAWLLVNGLLVGSMTIIFSI